jgi:RHS repeat-associated protein
VLSRQAYGPYGEQLGIFPDAMVSDVGYAGYVDDRNTTGLMYTPNRYLSLNASFMSVDPSGSINIHDPRTFNQYAYVAGNPLTFVDPQGLNWFNIDGTWEWHAGQTYHGQESPYTHLLIATTTKVRSDGSRVYAISLWNQNQRLDLDSIAYSGGAPTTEGPARPIPNGNYLIRADLSFDPPTEVNPSSPDHNPPQVWGIQTMGPATRSLKDPVTGNLWDVEAAYGSMRARMQPFSSLSPDKGYYFHGQRADYRYLTLTHGCLTTVTDDKILQYLWGLHQTVPVAINMPARLPQ